MMYDYSEYKRFLQTELDTQIKEFEQVINTKALVLKERGEIFVGRFLKVQPNGMAVFKVRYSDNMPRKNSFWTATYLIGDMGSFKNWGEKTWGNLRHDYQRIFSDAHCAWISQSEEESFCLIGIKNLSVEFAQILEKEKPIIAFGPQDPPLQYLLNLIDLVKDSSCEPVRHFLEYDDSESTWNPEKIDSKTDLVSLLKGALSDNPCLVIQGPPGTGKTYKMAQLTAGLLSENKSVLVTALTNQALIELAKKDDLIPFLKEGKVSKTSLTVDESRELPKLLGIKSNKCDASPGCLSLATFYLSSGWAVQQNQPPFDYVIMDEASQAFLPMIAALKKLGRKIIMIGDQNQLAPIVITNEDLITRNQWTPIVKGFETVCENYRFKSFMLSDTYRLTQRGADCTGVFYNNELQSVSEYKSIPSKLTGLIQSGGPVLLELDLKVGDKVPENAFERIYEIVNNLHIENPKAEIAILSKFRETVRQLQKYFVLRWNSKELPENIKIETVDSVQGLTVDYCFFLIPNASIRYSLESELFNVATSRAKYNTVIVSNVGLLRENMPIEVRKYLLKAQEDKFVTFETQKNVISAGDIKVKVVDKIDLSKFDKKRKEIVEGKENIYIIDTNVFVSCPDIISRIGKEYKVIVPAKVLDELDKLKLKPDVDKKALNDAARNINYAFSKNYSQMEDADVSLLPNGFDRKNPDCMILSVALRHKNDNPILLTSDSILQTRAGGLGIKTISLKDFLRR